jgi:hypothetical protein
MQAKTRPTRTEGDEGCGARNQRVNRALVPCQLGRTHGLSLMPPLPIFNGSIGTTGAAPIRFIGKNK